MVDRKSVLDEIMRIEGQIGTIRRDPTYLRIKRNLNYLESRRHGRTTVVASPDDLEKTLEMKNNSPELRGAILRYRERQKDYDVQMDNLYIEKVRLREQLFKQTA
jgi:hypothetical protein